MDSPTTSRSVTWKDCVPASTFHPYITFTSICMSPSPLVIPGNITVGVQATIHHHFGTDVRMVVKMDKLMLGQWTKIPCSESVGSCHYDSVCDFVSTYMNLWGCPTQLEQHGINCTCPFNPSSIDLPPSVFGAKVNSRWQWIMTGRFRVQAEMIHGHDIVGCFHVEFDIKRVVGSGFIFG
ncbi:ganglioside GM2 activator-like [Crassostrea virginica]